MDPIPHPQTQNDDHTLNKNPLPTNNQPTNPSSVVNNTAAPSSASSAPASPVSAAAPSSASSAPASPVSAPSPSPASSVSAASSSSTPAPTASPELDSLMSELSNYQPTTDDLQPSTGASTSMESASNTSPSSLAPTDPTLSVSSFSATPSAPNSGLTSDPGLMFDPVQSQQDDSALDSTQFTTSASTQSSADMMVGGEQASQTVQTEAKEDDDQEDQEEQPLVAAAPAPGSIGSAISYADFEKKQAEEAAKQAKNQNKPKIKLTRTTILIIAAIILFVIAGIIFALMFLSEPQKKPTQAAGKNQVEKASTKMLTCVRPLSTNESSEVGAAYGNFERQFTFENDSLSGISEHYIYQYNSENEAVTAKTTLDAGIKSDDNIKVTTEINLNQLKKKTAISGNNVDNYLKSLSEFSSITNHDLNSLMLAENQTGLSCSTVE